LDGVFMNSAIYKRTTNLCIVVAAASVILFDKFPELHRLAGAFLITSGVVATAVHLYVQWRPFQRVEEMPPAEAESSSLGNPIEKTQEPVHVAETLAWTGTEWRTVQAAGSWGKAPFKTWGVKDRSRADESQLFADAQWFSVVSLSRPSIDAATVAEVCEKLAATEMDFEVTLTGDGSLIIRPMRRKQVFQTAASEPRFTKGELETSGRIQ
jgi:hypothetical protein